MPVLPCGASRVNSGLISRPLQAVVPKAALSGRLNQSRKSVMTGAAKVAPSGTGFDFPKLQEVDYSRYGEVEKKALSRIKKLSAGHLHRNWVSIRARHPE